MKTYYTTFIISLMALLCTAQGYEFGIVHNGAYNFKVVAIPNFDSVGNTDVSDVGFALFMPAGSADIINQTGLLGGRPWDIFETDATILTANGLGDGTKDVFLLQLPPGQTFLAHTSGQQIDLVSFDVSNTPTSGEMTFMLNSDPINMVLGNALDSFYNSNIDATTTQDYFSGLAFGMEIFDFSTLGIEDSILLKSITVYPNPASDFIYISSSVSLEKIQLYDVLGKQVLNTTETKQLKVDYLQSGIYFLRLFVNKVTATIKIVIE